MKARDLADAGEDVCICDAVSVLVLWRLSHDFAIYWVEGFDYRVVFGHYVCFVLRWFGLHLHIALEVEALHEAFHVGDATFHGFTRNEESVHLKASSGGDDDAVDLVASLEF